MLLARLSCPVARASGSASSRVARTDAYRPRASSAAAASSSACGTLDASPVDRATLTARWANRYACASSPSTTAAMLARIRATASCSSSASATTRRRAAIPTSWLPWNIAVIPANCSNSSWVPSGSSDRRSASACRATSARRGYSPGQAERLAGPHHRAQRQLPVLAQIAGRREQGLPGVRDRAGAQLDLAEQELRLGIDVLGYRGRLDAAQQHPGPVRLAALPRLAGRGDQIGGGHDRVGGEVGGPLERPRGRGPRGALGRGGPRQRIGQARVRALGHRGQMQAVAKRLRFGVEDLGQQQVHRAPLGQGRVVVHDRAQQRLREHQRVAPDLHQVRPLGRLEGGDVDAGGAAGPHERADVEIGVRRGQEHQPLGVGRQLGDPAPQHTHQGAVRRQAPGRPGLAPLLLRRRATGPARPSRAGCRRTGWPARRPRRRPVRPEPGRPTGRDWWGGRGRRPRRWSPRVAGPPPGHRYGRRRASRSAPRAGGAPRTRARPATGGPATAHRRRSTAPAGRPRRAGAGRARRRRARTSHPGRRRRSPAPG